MGFILKEQTVLTGQEIIELRHNRKFGDKREEDFSGIYCIKNTINNKVYIGSGSGNGCGIKHRWASHVYILENGTHFNDHLQKAWNTYGAENFSFSVIEKIEDKFTQESENFIRLREQYYFEQYDVFNREKRYNISPKASGGSWILSEETLKQGKSKQLNWEQYIQIKKLLIDTDIPLTEIAKQVGVSKTIVKRLYAKETMFAEIKDCIFQKRTSNCHKIRHDQEEEICNLYKKGYSIKKISAIFSINCGAIKKILDKHDVKYNVSFLKSDQKIGCSIIVYQYSLDGKFLQKHDSAAAAAHSLGKNSGQKILNCCQGKYKTIYGYRWSYEFQECLDLNSTYEIIIGKPITGRSRPIIEYDLNGIPVNIYESVHEAARAKKGNSSQILYHMKQQTTETKNIAYNSRWQYADKASEEDLQYLLKLKQNPSLIESEDKLKTKNKKV